MSHGTKGNGVDPLDDSSARTLPAFPLRFILNPGRANVAWMSRFTVHGHKVYAEYHLAGKKKTAVALADVLLHSEDSIKKMLLALQVRCLAAHRVLPPFFSHRLNLVWWV